MYVCICRIHTQTCDGDIILISSAAARGRAAFRFLNKTFQFLYICICARKLNSRVYVIPHAVCVRTRNEMTLTRLFFKGIELYDFTNSVQFVCCGRQ